MPTQLKPAKPIRRFDVFAEYRRLDAEDDGMPADQAKGYGLWVAKVVAARKFGRQPSDRSGEQQAKPRSKWHVLSGEPQTDKRFDHEIVDRMGAEFYQRVFAPAVLESGMPAEVLVAPFQFRCTPLHGGARVPVLGEMSRETAQETEQEVLQ